MRPSICLNMIVKDESSIIEETLNNIINHIKIDYFVICDTGSSDNTVDIINTFFKQKNIKGELYQDEWKNFAHNRNLALERAKNKSDYVLIFDADDRFEGNIDLSELSLDCYQLKMTLDRNIYYYRPLIVKNNGDFYWRSAVHEFLTSEKAFSKGKIMGDYTVIAGTFGARNNNKNKYLQDALDLEKEFYFSNDDDLKPRYAYYIARSYEAANLWNRAIEWYEKRIELGGWIEEVTNAYLEMGECYLSLNKEQEAINSWLKGYNYNPKRAESLYYVAKAYREKGELVLAYQFGKIALSIAYPKSDILFVRDKIYDYWLYYELSISSYYVDDFKIGYECCKKVLLSDGARFIAVVTAQNLRFYKEYAKYDTKETIKALLEKINGFSDEEYVNDVIVYLNSLLD